MKKYRNKLIIFILSCILVLILLRSFGVIDLNLYKSELKSNENASMGLVGELGSYDIVFEYNGKTVYNYSVLRNNIEPIPVRVKINSYKYNGNYYMPFFKKFSMEYNCTFSTTKDANSKVFEGNGDLDGKIEGIIQAEVKGLCSIRKAKVISEEKALEAIRKYVIDSLNK